MCAHALDSIARAATLLTARRQIRSPRAVRSHALSSQHRARRHFLFPRAYRAEAASALATFALDSTAHAATFVPPLR
jgi:hypothetical protein